jgi:hypothetical protein
MPRPGDKRSGLPVFRNLFCMIGKDQHSILPGRGAYARYRDDIDARMTSIQVTVS